MKKLHCWKKSTINLDYLLDPKLGCVAKRIPFVQETLTVLKENQFYLYSVANKDEFSSKILYEIIDKTLLFWKPKNSKEYNVLVQYDLNGKTGLCATRVSDVPATILDILEPNQFIMYDPYDFMPYIYEIGELTQ